MAVEDQDPAAGLELEVPAWTVMWSRGTRPAPIWQATNWRQIRS